MRSPLPSESSRSLLICTVPRIWPHTCSPRWANLNALIISKATSWGVRSADRPHSSMRPRGRFSHVRKLSIKARENAYTLSGLHLSKVEAGPEKELVPVSKVQPGNPITSLARILADENGASSQ